MPRRQVQEVPFPPKNEGVNFDPLGHQPIDDQLSGDLGSTLEKVFVGGNEAENSAIAAEKYTELFDNLPGSDHHAVASEAFTDRLNVPFSPIPGLGTAVQFIGGQLGGGSVEVAENKFGDSDFGSNANVAGRTDNFQDLISNALGGLTSVAPEFAKQKVRDVGSSLQVGINNKLEGADPIDLLPEGARPTAAHFLRTIDRPDLKKEGDVRGGLKFLLDQFFSGGDSRAGQQLERPTAFSGIRG